MNSLLRQRQTFPVDETIQQYNISLIVRWVIFGILVLMVLSALLAYSHAKGRMAKGLPPKAYHRWMVRQQQRQQFEPSLQNEFSFYRAAAPEYDLEALPPPVYDPNHVPPPTYQPPAGGSKVNPTQEYDRPPSSPPPFSVLSMPGAVEAPIESPPPTARSVRSPWMPRFKRSTK
ncbi:hypothetical protein MMC32_001845 [Xylographa parallela]|nr:hypothetical protein [Xylographa parallela]